MGAAPSNPIVIIFGKFSGLTDVMKSTKFLIDRSMSFFVRWVPENGMFP
jgi:hypothetical protein